MQEYETHGAAGTPEYQQLLNDFLNGVSYWIYAASLGLSWPSHDPDTNWRVAGALKDWLCKQEF